MTFFSTPERIAIGGMPFIASHEKPTRRDGLAVLPRAWRSTTGSISGRGRRCVERDARATAASSCQVRRPPRRARPTAPARWSSRPATSASRTTSASRARTCRTSATTSPRGTRYWHRRVVVIGAGNSSVDAALECWRAGATVTLVHFGDEFDRKIKPWVLPDIANRVKEGQHRGAVALPGARHHADARWRSRPTPAGRWSVSPPTRCSR